MTYSPLLRYDSPRIFPQFTYIYHTTSTQETPSHTQHHTSDLYIPIPKIVTYPWHENHDRTRWIHLLRATDCLPCSENAMVSLPYLTLSLSSSTWLALTHLVSWLPRGYSRLSLCCFTSTGIMVLLRNESSLLTYLRESSWEGCVGIEMLVDGSHDRTTHLHASLMLRIFPDIRTGPITSKVKEIVQSLTQDYPGSWYCSLIMCLALHFHSCVSSSLNTGVHH